MTDEAHVIQAEPTKAFFISMLVRDIDLVPAIVDLVDNSVDGARRLRTLPDDSERCQLKEMRTPRRRAKGLTGSG